MREMDANKTVGVREVWAPNRFVVHALRGRRRAVRAGGAGADRRAQARRPRDRRSSADGDSSARPRSSSRSTSQLGKGRFEVRGLLRRGRGGARAARTAARRRSTLYDGWETGPDVRARRAPVDDDRAAPRDATSSCADPGASRQHARISRRRRRVRADRSRLDERDARERRGRSTSACSRTAIASRSARPSSSSGGPDVSPFVLSVLKYALLVLLYFFVFRAVRSVAVDDRAAASASAATTQMRSPSRRLAAKPSQGRQAADAGRRARGRRRARHGRSASTDSVEIGRADGCAIRLSDTYVSQVHARLYGGERGLVRRGPRLDERHLPERPTVSAARRGPRRRRRQDRQDRPGAARDEGRGRRWRSATGHRPGPRGQRGLLPGRGSAVRRRRRHGRTPRAARSRRTSRSRRSSALFTAAARERSPSRSSEANRAVFERSQQRSRRVGDGHHAHRAPSCRRRQVRLAHVGDSRAYLFRDGELRLLTEDHTLVHKMVLEGEITAEEAETHPHRSILTRALGVDGSVQVDEGDRRAAERRPAPAVHRRADRHGERRADPGRARGVQATRRTRSTARRARPTAPAGSTTSRRWSSTSPRTAGRTATNASAVAAPADGRAAEPRRRAAVDRPDITIVGAPIPEPPTDATASARPPRARVVPDRRSGRVALADGRDAGSASWSALVVARRRSDCALPRPQWYVGRLERPGRDLPRRPGGGRRVRAALGRRRDDDPRRGGASRSRCTASLSGRHHGRRPRGRRRDRRADPPATSRAAGRSRRS